MRINAKAIRNLAISLAMLIAFSSVLVSHVAVKAADGRLNLPPDLVTIEVSNGTDSYFNTLLSGIPADYDVTNATYPGWCVDVRAEMTRSPATHEVKLYSSLNPPGDLANQTWDKVNYILNHQQGTAVDMQQAIWFFINIDGNYTPSTQMAWTIINDALFNGSGFIPAYGQTMAVICFPVILFPGAPDVQISIIELANPVIPEFPSTAVVLLFATATLAIAIIYKRKIR